MRNTKYIGKYMYGGQEVEGACEALIDEETFNKVQEMLDSRSHGKNAKKVRLDYLLHGKAFCGHCGTKLVGDAGTSKTGKYHAYYACGKRKKHHTCDKKNEKKDFLEWYVVEQTIEYVLSPARIDNIAASVVAAYENEFNDKRIKDFERQVKKIDAEVEKLVDLIVAMPKEAAPKLGEKIAILEMQKNDINKELATLRIANSRQLTKGEIVKWLKSFCRGDLLDFDFQKRIIDLLINSIYLYDDRIVIYYNVKSGKQISYIEMCDDMEGLTPLGDSNVDDVGSGVEFEQRMPLSGQTALSMR